MELQALPDLAKSLQKLKLAVRLEEELQGDSVIAWTIRKGLNENNTNAVFSYIKSQANDNMKIMRDVIGDDLLTEILNF